MNPRQARRERREAERKAKKLELKKGRLAEQHPLAAVDDFPQIQPRWNPELEDEFPREVQIRNNAIADRISLQAGLPIPPPGPSPVFKTAEDLRQHLLAQRKTLQPNAGFVSQQELPTPESEIGFVSQDVPKARETATGFVSQTNPSRAEINRANAQKSTGPTSTRGKLASSGNSLKHGLASGQLIIPGEDPAAFESLLNALLADHQPASSTEELLIQEMAKSYWLGQRAIRYQNACFTQDGVNEKQLALFLRYQTTHDRAFYKALNTLLQCKKTARLTKHGFVSQPAAQKPDSPGFVSHSTTQPASDAGFLSQNDLLAVANQVQHLTRYPETVDQSSTTPSLQRCGGV